MEVAAVAVSSSAQADAKTLNRKGEEAYHAGNLQQAIDLYRQAIELNNGYGRVWLL
ncbi:tetratricopeptide repeat protein [Pseudomonas chlororaphis]|uniref:tetratricopeptide repeat protein n=1 Tax=Pseudomonas chlororaphis TaxID=587753 RepID=UPI003D0B53DA